MINSSLQLSRQSLSSAQDISESIPERRASNIRFVGDGSAYHSNISKL